MHEVLQLIEDSILISSGQQKQIWQDSGVGRLVFGGRESSLRVGRALQYLLFLWDSVSLNNNKFVEFGSSCKAQIADED